MQIFQRNGLRFDVVDSGSADGPVVILLHGFPQWNDCWIPIAEALAAAGYRCLAPNQRGYSAGARPKGRRAYRMSELVEDVAALLDAAEVRRAHVVGHDWGAFVAWAFAARHPERVATLTALSVPHPAAFLRAVFTTGQLRSSSYMFFFQLPVLPERVLAGTLVESLSKTGMPPAAADRVASGLAGPGALTAAINWYRGFPLTRQRDLRLRITVPTLFVWSDGDVAVRRSTAEACESWVSGPYRFEVLPAVSHWIPDEAPEVAGRLLLRHFSEYEGTG